MMFTTPAPSAPTLSTTTSPASPTSPTRSGRLRGLSYLRSYTHNHISSHLSHSSNASSTSSAAHRRPSLSRTRSSPASHALRRSSTHPDQLPTASRTAHPESTSAAASSDNTTDGWLPSVGGSHGAATASVRQDNTLTTGETTSASTMTRSRTEPGASSSSAAAAAASTLAGADGAAERAEGQTPKPPLPSIRFIPHQDPRATRPSLQFPPITRTLPDESCVIKIGRYSERDNIPDVPMNVPSAAPVGFKSKVVSRKHCVFWCENSQWYIKDVKSSSGTFLNHIRLSQPGVESKPYKVKDGDIVQLGIDFRGGEEMIFRCVKIRIECNRGWQQGLNTFNKQTHQRLRKLAKIASSHKDSDAASTTTSECSICLMNIAPCQSLFVAPCSHVWHYKCIRPILTGHTYPTFLCPNCRGVTDLEADVDEPEEEWEDDFEIEDQGHTAAANTTTTSTNPLSALPEEGSSPSALPAPRPSSAFMTDADLAAAMENAHIASQSDSSSSASASASAHPPTTHRANPAATPLRHTLVPSTPSTAVAPPSAFASSSSSTTTPLPISSSTGAAASHRRRRFSATSSSESSSSESSCAAGSDSASNEDGDGEGGSGGRGRGRGVLLSAGAAAAAAADGGARAGSECPMTPRNDAGPFVLDGQGQGGVGGGNGSGVVAGS